MSASHGRMVDKRQALILCERMFRRDLQKNATRQSPPAVNFSILSETIPRVLSAKRCELDLNFPESNTLGVFSVRSILDTLRTSHSQILDVFMTALNQSQDLGEKTGLEKMETDEEVIQWNWNSMDRKQRNFLAIVSVLVLIDNRKFASSAFSSMPIRGNKGIRYSNTTQKIEFHQENQYTNIKLQKIFSLVEKKVAERNCEDYNEENKRKTEDSLAITSTRVTPNIKRYLPGPSGTSNNTSDTEEVKRKSGSW
ncbi:4198_t:CDS:2 [Paraglomus occultum]|uniref:4198_t:CDS:1 n=1 Tax=Paraglomus occultum TaxID=144539 RepID=A0A9N9AP96_9GLOM|nr:4198_t:CDS:2 [Paraglomus occultum]